MNYIGYLIDRKELGYKCFIDTQCGNRLLLVTLNGKRKIFVIIVGIIIIFSNVKSAKAIGPSLPAQQRVVSIRDPNRLIKPSKVKINLDIQPKIIMPSLSKSIGSVRTKFDLRNSQKEFVCEIRGGDNEKLIKSIISKVSEADWDIPSINKILKKLAEVTLENDKLLRILAELEKPFPNSLFAEGFVPIVAAQSTPFAEYLLDSTKCYGHREAYNTPRSVSKNFKTSAVKKLSNTSLKNPRLNKKAIKAKIEEGVHPVNLSDKSTYVSSSKVLVKKSEGRYLVDVSDIDANIVAIGNRSDRKSMARFQKLTNELYNLNLKGY